MKFAPVLLSALALGVSACGGSPEEAPAADAAATDTAATEAAAPAGGAAAPAAATFDIASVPVSTATLPAFPYVAVPAGYQVRNEATMDLAAFPIWTGAAFQTVEGKVHMASSATPDGKTYSRLEFTRSVENAVKALGGVQITSSEAPIPVIDELPQSLRGDMSLGFGPVFGNAITTYVIRRADRTIWVHLVSDSNHATWAVIDGPATPAT